jgi:7-cyano-7-deazaguanine synthase
VKSVVLLSGGLDSSVNLFAAKEAGSVALALTFDYGQRAAPAEIRSSKKLSSQLGIPHQVLALPFFSQWGGSSLVDRTQAVPGRSEVKIDDLQASQKTAKSVWVPNRNGIMLNIAAGFAESLGADAVIPGFNLEEAATFPDNTEVFLRALTQSFSYSTSNHVRAHCFTTALKKPDIVRLGQRAGVPFADIWPCYHAGAKWCGECESCQRAKRAFSEAGESWP